MTGLGQAIGPRATAQSQQRAQTRVHQEVACIPLSSGSQYARRLESTGGSYYFLDLTALGRQEEWEQPTGRSESARSATPDFAS